MDDDVLDGDVLDGDVVLLTGATGLVGAAALHSLLVHTRCCVFCMIRAKKDVQRS